MVWIRIDDQFADHPKVAAAGPLAAWLHVCGLCYCGRHLTDGFVPHGAAIHLAAFPHIGVSTGGVPGMFECGHDVEVDQLIGELLDAGLWEPVEGGYVIHDYLDYNPSREQVLADREQHIEAGRAGGLTTQARKRAKGQATAKATAKAKCQAELKPVPVPVPVPMPDPEPDMLDESGTLKECPTDTPPSGDVGRLIAASYRNIKDTLGRKPASWDSKPWQGVLRKMLKDNAPEQIEEWLGRYPREASDWIKKRGYPASEFAAFVDGLAATSGNNGQHAPDPTPKRRVLTAADFGPEPAGDLSPAQATIAKIKAGLPKPPDTAAQSQRGRE
jgi:hypothetical protein